MTESGNIPDPLKELRISQAHFVTLRDGMNGRLVFRKQRGDNHLLCTFPMNINRGHHQHVAPTPWSSPSWEPNTSSASQEIPRILWNMKVHYHIHNSPPPVPILSQINPVHPTSWRTFLILSTPGSSKRQHSLRFPHQNPVSTSPLPHTC
jgi:hypothetical protein